MTENTVIETFELLISLCECQFIDYPTLKQNASSIILNQSMNQSIFFGKYIGFKLAENLINDVILSMET